jgi:Putative transposase
MVEVVYKPRKPKASPLYQSISEHFSEFESVYEEGWSSPFKPSATWSIFIPHLPCLVTDACFMANDWFYVLPEIDIKKLESLFRHKVLKLLLSDKRICEELVEKLLSWKNSGFSVHNQVKIKSRDRRGRESLAQYILRSPFSLEKITYQQQTKTVLYRSKMNPVLKKNFAVFPVLD